MIVKNAERHLADCLQSVQGIVDEIVVADTGSTDSSVEIARRAGARVFPSPGKMISPKLATFHLRK